MAMDPADEYTCGICLDFLNNPVETPCGHEFCEPCMNVTFAKKRECPVCREEIAEGSIQPALKMRRAMMLKYLPCPQCRVPFRVDGLRAHASICKRAMPTVPPDIGIVTPRQAGMPISAAHHGMSAAARGQQVASQRPNRDTFHCPLCREGPLDCLDLTDHVTNTHAGSKEKVVCPVCAVMPWGDPHQQSSDYVQHVKIRHRFEYDRFVDYDATDEESLQHAVSISTVLQ